MFCIKFIAATINVGNVKFHILHKPNLGEHLYNVLLNCKLSIDRVTFVFEKRKLLFFVQPVTIRFGVAQDSK